MSPTTELERANLDFDPDSGAVVEISRTDLMMLLGSETSDAVGIRSTPIQL